MQKMTCQHKLVLSRNSCGVPHYTRTGLEISGNRFYGVVNSIIIIIFFYYIIKYRYGILVSIYSNL